MLPTLAVLRSFEAAAKHQSFTAAAEELHISQAVVSRQVRELEEIIGTQLFRKDGRGVALTEAGRALAADLHAGLERLRDVVRKAQGAGEAARTLTVAALPTFSSRWLARRLTGFRQKHPAVRLIIKNRSEPFDLVREGVDVAIHFGSPDWVGGKLTELCPEDLVAVAAPSMIPVADRMQIANLPLLHLTSRRTAWPAFFEQQGLDPAKAVTGDFFDQFSTMIGAATAGLGAAITPSYLIEAELSQGSLVDIGRPDGSSGTYYAVTPAAINNPLARDFCTWIREEARHSTLARRGGG